MTQVKFILYGITIVCYLAAGILDLVQRHPKPGILAIAFGILNVAIFFWRTGE
jgi:hypothetical protein